MDAPVRGGVAVRAFDGPELPWQSGHRGVDMAASQGEPLLAPIDATVSFVGTVGGKRVVSLAHGDWTLTFEPAVTDLRNGSRVARGERCGTVGTGSDHCDGSCVHWGIRLQGRRYLDPATFLSASRIRLVPVR
ncbi:MAG: M23 family metallopeptidase [Bifidobacterium sp.]|nr:M23 family metallopeptidase [Bifidobacterium sp.]